jgi:hypothetical protein
MLLWLQAAHPVERTFSSRGVALEDAAPPLRIGV